MTHTTPSVHPRSSRWWSVGLCALFAVGLGLRAVLPTPEAGLATDRPPTAERRELNLFRHYERDLRAVLSGYSSRACATRLAADIGCSVVQDAQRYLVSRRFPEGVAVFAGPLQLTDAEQEAWLLMLMILNEDENRPSWHKAGVRR